MKKSLILTIALISSLVSANLYAIEDRLNPILTGVPSLSITPDARAGGMGDVGAATSADVNSQYWNPSKYAFIESPGGFAFSYTPWMSKIVKDINLAYLTGYYRLNETQTLSASLRYFSLGEVQLNDAEGQSLGSTQPNEFAIDAAYSRLLSQNFSAAVAMRFIYSNLSGGMIDNMFPGMTVAADIAATYKTPIRLSTTDGTLAFGLNISNIGNKISYNKGSNNIFIPTNMRLGTSFEYPIDDYNKITVNFDINKLLVPSKPLKADFTDGLTSGTAEYTAAEEAYIAADNKYENESVMSGIFSSFNDAPGGFSEEMKEIAWGTGLEYAYNKQFLVRGGYFHESTSKGNRKFFTAGAGFKLNMFQLDASYVISTAQTNPLDQTIRFSLSFDMNGLKDLMK